MQLTRRSLIGAGAATFLTSPLRAAESLSMNEALWLMIAGDRAGFERGITVVRAYARADLVPSLILAQRFSKFPGDWFEPEMQRLAGTDKPKGWFNWVLWQERNDQIAPHPDYADLKRRVFTGLDPNFAIFLKPKYLKPKRMKIRLEEIVWGGVRKDGIPSLDDPRLVVADQQDYLRADDLVFGVSINGDARAYPLRIMGWHEMFNDVIGGVPLALAYCTLCGSGILYETKLANRSKPFVFGSSGFLYRSNKLMFDRQTHSLWNQFTGKPVVGRLARSGIELKQRPVVIAPWSEWLRDNPDTQVLALNTGHRRDYGSGVVYSRYFASPDLMFPAAVDENRLKQKDYVFGIRQFGAAKAWPLKVFRKSRVINDEIASRKLVLIGDQAGRTVRAYERGDHTFKLSAAGLRDADGGSWDIGEEQLRAEGGATLPRVAGHIAYWFAWDGYVGSAGELYQP